MTPESHLLFDSRWSGLHGIGRFARELRTRLPGPITDLTGAHPVSARGLAESELSPHRVVRGREQETTYFSPGYTPCLSWRGPHAFTVHDLIHLDVPGERSRIKDLYYRQVVRRAVRRRAGVVLTVSAFSRDRIAEWAGVPTDRIQVVGNGVSTTFRPDGQVHNDPAGPYVLHVGNTKPHKNLPTVLTALSGIPEARLVLVARPDADLMDHANRLGMQDRIQFVTDIDDATLAALYRGAQAVVTASTYEGFGMSALEGMACGVPVVASDLTSLPEVVGDAAVMVDPADVDSVRSGIERALTDADLRTRLAQAGPERAADFRWDAVAHRVATALELDGENR